MGEGHERRVDPGCRLRRTWFTRFPGTFSKRGLPGFRKEDAAQLSGLFADDAIFTDPRYPPLTGKPAIAAYYQHLLAEATDWGSCSPELRNGVAHSMSSGEIVRG